MTDREVDKQELLAMDIDRECYWIFRCTIDNWNDWHELAESHANSPAEYRQFIHDRMMKPMNRIRRCIVYFREETAELKQQLATATEQLQAVHSHVAEALQLLGVDISVDGYMPDSWTLREQCHLAKQQLAERDRQAQAWEQTALKVHAWITELHSSVKEVLSPTVMQWLGTNCGWAFLDSVLQKCGYQIVPAAGWKEGSRDG